MKVYIDTEFTDFIDKDLISLALVAEDGSHFYGENLDYNKEWASHFVKENVLPLCDFNKFGMKRLRLSAKAWSWIEDLPTDEVILMEDYGGDHELLDDLFGERHFKIKRVLNVYAPCAFPLHFSIEERMRIQTQSKNVFKVSFQNFLKDNSLIPHNALNDARANEYAHRKMMDYVYLNGGSISTIPV